MMVLPPCLCQRKKNPMTKSLRLAGLTMVMLLLCGLVAFGALYALSGGRVVSSIQTALLRLQLANRQDELQTAVSADDRLIRFTIASGDTPAIIARNLTEAGLITDADLFITYLRVEGLDTRVQATTYFLNAAQTIPQITSTIIDSRNSTIIFRVVEGSRLEEIAAGIDANPRFGFTGADFLAATSQADRLRPDLLQALTLSPERSVEGFLAPNTYNLPPDITAAELRDLLIEAFLAQLTPDDLVSVAGQGLTLNEVVTLASIIERESVFSDEDATIASVYRNRLTIGMPLQADPTVQYGLNGSRGAWWPQITQSDYTDVNSPYNTYLINGLPPNAIANPSLSALQAAIYPQQTPYYYFRARCDGSMRHEFAITYEEHLANGC